MVSKYFTKPSKVPDVHISPLQGAYNCLQNSASNFKIYPYKGILTSAALRSVPSTTPPLQLD